MKKMKDAKKRCKFYQDRRCTIDNKICGLDLARCCADYVDKNEAV